MRLILSGRREPTHRRFSFALVQTALPDYRQRILELMADELGEGFVVYVGDEHFQPTARTDVSLEGHLTPVENRYLVGRRLLWQRLPLQQVLKADVVMAEINPRVLSSWLVLLARKLRGRRTVLWGHAWPRAGREASSDRLRHLQRRIADALVVYTESQRRELQEVMGSVPVHSAPNAIYAARDLGPLPPRGQPSSFIFVGRLIPTKKPKLLLDAFVLAQQELPTDAQLVLVGEGPLRRDLETTARSAGVQDRVVFTGHISDLGHLRELYADSIASVSPGYVGLSIIQSLGFGVPMIYGRDEPHAPEIEAAIDNFNARSVPSDSPRALANELVAFGRARDEWLARREELARWCAERYSAEVMAARLVRAGRGDLTT